MAAPNILSVSDLNRYIKLVLERETNLQDVWVRGKSPTSRTIPAAICILP